MASNKLDELLDEVGKADSYFDEKEHFTHTILGNRLRIIELEALVKRLLENEHYHQPERIG